MKYYLVILCFFWLVPLNGQDNIALVASNEKTNIETKRESEENSFISRFRLHDRLIMVEAELDGKKGNYILDTGSPYLMINQKTEKGSSIIGGVTKKCQAEIVEINEFKWAGVSAKSFQAVAFDMSNLEKTFGAKIDGLIGQGLFNNYELVIDFSSKIIKLIPPQNSKFHKRNSYKQKIKFSLENHLPVIKLKIDGKKYRFGIDTGAEINVLDKKLKDQLDPSLFSNWKAGKVYGVDGNSEALESAELSVFSIKKERYKNFSFMLMDLSNLKNEFDMKLDGILGFPFLSQNVISINYQKKRIYIW